MTKKKTKVPKQKVATPSTKRKTVLESLASAVGAFYAKDPCRAGVVLSDLGNGIWYCSVVRYKATNGHEKQVVCSTKQASLASAIEVCTRQFQEIVSAPRKALLDLERTVRAMNNGPR